MAEEQFLKHEGRRYCRFHAPMEARDGIGVAKHDWRHDRIRAFNDEIIVLLGKTEPGDSTDFTGVVFLPFIAFSGTEEAKNRELGSISFRKAVFSGDAMFDGATFFGDAGFVGATFSGVAGFDGATFSGDAEFDRATFTDFATFTGATFTYFATFAGATFRKRASFSGSGTGGAAEFNRISFGPDYNGPCRFEGSADFSNRTFRESANFREAVFATAPLFHNSKLHQGTDFTGVQWLDRDGNAAPAYRTLKLAMAEMRARDEEGMFAALEQECRRKQGDTPRFVKALSYAYELTSGYGQYAGRPILWLMGVAAVSFAVYLGGYSRMPSASPAKRISLMGETLRFTLRQIIDPFSAFQKTEDYTVACVFNDPPLGLALLAGVQSLLSLGMIALFLLALRWRFRRD